MKNLTESLKLYLSQWSGHKEKAAQLLDVLTTAFKAITDSKPITIILRGYNGTDGTGDFKHLIDFYMLIKDIFKDCPNVTIKLIAFVDEVKSTKYQFFMPPTWLDTTKVYTYDGKSAFSAIKASQSDFIFICPDIFEKKTTLGTLGSRVKPISTIEPNQNLIAELGSNQFIKNLFDSADLLLNVSLPFEVSANILLDLVNKNCLIYSALEYGPTTLQKKRYLNQRHYVEDHMGVRRGDIGLKINDDLWNLAHENDNPIKKAQLLLRYTNRSTLKAILKADNETALTQVNAESYLASTDFNMGYLQSPSTTMQFIHLILSTSKKNVDILINAGLFQGDLDLLTKYGITQLQLFDHDGNLQKNIPIGNQSQPSRTLRIFDLKISQVDSLILQSEAIKMGASGDNSMGELVATGAFPYPGLNPWKAEFLLSVIQFIQDRNEDDKHAHLIRYLQYTHEYMDRDDYKDQFTEVCQHAAQHYDEIKKSWAAICEALYKERNVKQYLQELAYGFMLALLFKYDDRLNYLKKALDLIVAAEQINVPINKEHLLYIAMTVTDNLSPILLLLDKKINLETRFPGNPELRYGADLTPLWLCTQLNNDKLANFLISYGADYLEYNFAEECDLLTYWVRNNREGLIKTTLVYKRGLNLLNYSTDERAEVAAYIINRQELRDLAIVNPDNYAGLLYYAIEQFTQTSDPKLIKILSSQTDKFVQALFVKGDIGKTIYEIIIEMNNESLTSLAKSVIKDTPADKLIEYKTGVKTVGFFVRDNSNGTKEIHFNEKEKAWKVLEFLNSKNIFCPRVDIEEDYKLTLSKEQFDFVLYSSYSATQTLEQSPTLDRLLQSGIDSIVQNQIGYKPYSVKPYGKETLILSFDENFDIRTIKASFKSKFPGIKIKAYMHDHSLEIMGLLELKKFEEKIQSIVQPSLNLQQTITPKYE